MAPNARRVRLQGIRRFLYVWITLMRHGGALAVASARQKSSRRTDAHGLNGPLRLRSLFEDLGGAFLKLGQMLALQPDILPVAYCNALFDLLDRIAPFPTKVADEMFRASTGKTFGEAFEWMNPEPIATASIGQVYAAVFGNRKVAVKVQRPGVYELFSGDIALSALAMRAIRVLRLRRLFWLLEPLQEFVVWTREELDYRVEAKYLEFARQRAESNPAELIPGIIGELSTANTLVLEFLEGVTVLDYLRALESDDQKLMERVVSLGFDATQFARHLIDNFMRDAFRHGMFHADLHPANLMITRNNVVGYIDFGITGVLSRQARRHLARLTFGLTRADIDSMCDAFMKMSAKGDNADPAAFRTRLKRVSAEWYEYSGTERRLTKNLTLVMMEFLSACRQSGIWPERSVVKYIRSAVAIDGLITRFAPGFNLCRYIEDVCARNLRIQARDWLVSCENLLGVTASTARLFEDGVPRAAFLLRQWSERAAARELEESLAHHSAARRETAFELAAMLLLLSFVTIRTAEMASFDRALFIGEGATTLLVAVCCIGSLLRWQNFGYGGKYAGSYQVDDEFLERGMHGRDESDDNGLDVRRQP